MLATAGGEVMRKWLRRVSGEHASLSGSLPLTWTSSIFLAADPSRLDLLRSALLWESFPLQSCLLPEWCCPLSQIL